MFVNRILNDFLNEYLNNFEKVRAISGSLMPETIPSGRPFDREAPLGTGHLTLTKRHGLVSIQTRLPSLSLSHASVEESFDVFICFRRHNQII